MDLFSIKSDMFLPKKKKKMPKIFLLVMGIATEVKERNFFLAFVPPISLITE